MVWLLDNHYDVQHRAYLMAEKGEVIKLVLPLYVLIFYCLVEDNVVINLFVYLQELLPLKIRSHGASSSDMPYDERYKQKTAYEILRSDWSSDVCSSDLSRCNKFICLFARAYTVEDSVSWGVVEQHAVR